MPSKTPVSSLDNLNPDDYEIIETPSQELTLKKKPAGRPAVQANTARPVENGSSTSRVVVPGLGGVTLVIH